jgi:hypothetical protein
MSQEMDIFEVNLYKKVTLYSSQVRADGGHFAKQEYPAIFI